MGSGGRLHRLASSLLGMRRRVDMTHTRNQRGARSAARKGSPAKRSGVPTPLRRPRRPPNTDRSGAAALQIDEDLAEATATKSIEDERGGTRRRRFQRRVA